ncbi:MAG: alpha/beta hydrolase, partial [Actinobacteria bacterium]|nr:alpha/beta hydrolase [Actinomycetota bacterium]
MLFLKPLQNLSEAKDALALGLSTGLSTERLHKLTGSQSDNGQSRNGHQSYNDSLDAGRAVPTLNLRPKRVKHTVNMEHNVFIVEGRRMRYAVSDNYGDTPLASVALPEDVASDSGWAAGNPYSIKDESKEMWVVNLHGFFAGGGMYWEESRYLAEGLGLRVLAPSLPGFGGSDPLPWAKVNVYEIAGQVRLLMDHLGIENALLMGHSMGGAIAIAFAEMYPDRTL